MTKEITAPHCVQCNGEMEYGVSFYAVHPDDWGMTDDDKPDESTMKMYRLQTCNNPKCPNFGLLQVGEEGMKNIPNQPNNG